ncbi:MAG: UDP-N-acetylmuramoyl-L-alanyl-D-glutamate--2,6-diaminopimelate ligase [Acidobacteria bacterium]|nr:UDP-N-acetylmuramoyl-L-alanyl-D-glutamate--2,6-diaminopimelate ligase [Acidobacteriota bacterium]
MELEAVLAGVKLRRQLAGSMQTLAVTGLEYDSRRVMPGNLFVAFGGTKVDARKFAPQAMERGAVAVMSDLPRPEEEFDAVWIEVEHARRALALACRNFFGAPERDLVLSGVTGTNGKTTTATLMDALFRKAGHVTGLLGTIENRLGSERAPAVNTTPESLDLYRMFARLREMGGTHVSMEVSSHGLHWGRVYGLAFHTAVFTNLTQDHLDLHETFEAYFDAKKLLFFENGAAAPLHAAINVDDEFGQKIQPGPATQVLTYGFGAGACVRAENIAAGFDGIDFTLRYRGTSLPVHSRLLGTVNIYNVLAACTAGLAHGMDVEMIAEAIGEFETVPGRFEKVDEGQPFLVIVDYAHTPDALRNAVAVARTLKPNRVITLFGCGGDRDRSKRPLMGMAAAETSDYVVLTSDNPRSEDPLNIINDALVGLRRYDTPHTVEPNRAKAIRIAVEHAQPGDVLLLAGKGHETYQVLSDRTIDFDDREEARLALQEFGYRRPQG